ncbi:SixA phosphatase family protein [Asticcacaulis taihuensis]|uniref:Phosphohistidine phosphatase n=1 Tax=Asticcacaulis taihuensis TaxID=260084 RepID=A0A1G4QNJ7_9CAUL|nr:histidine phosphatase family protein [Asticcacaulis taihuensis]SCW46015.1 phosphohistidine phosphatase [Asticcacaulis taihuensis]
MKHLIIMRHGKAEKDAESGEDFDRTLADRGQAEAKSVAEALKAYGLKPDFALVSSAARTRGTFEAVKAVMGDIPALVSKDFYNAGSEALRRAIEAHEDDGQCVLVVGHNPGVQYLVAEYLFEGAAGPEITDKVRGNYPTATAAVFEVDAAGRPIYDGLYLAK